MNKNSLFTQTILIIILAVICIFLTVAFALLFGSIDTNIFDFKNFNFVNALPVLIVGIIISCFVTGIAILFLAKNTFFKVKKYFDNNDNNGGTKK